MNSFLRVIQKFQCLTVDLGARPDSYRCEEVLRRSGMDSRPHLHGRSLFEHLRATQELLSGWGMPSWIEYAGLFHNFYDHEAILPGAVKAQMRSLLRSLIGSKSERLVYLSSILSTDQLLNVNVGDLSNLSGVKGSDRPGIIDREMFGALLVLHCANEIEQATAPGSAPSPWLATVTQYLRCLKADGAPEYRCFQNFVFMTEQDETELLSTYHSALRLLDKDIADSERHLRRCANISPFLFEPWLWLSYIATLQHDHRGGRESAMRARCALSSWGGVWDRRLCRAEWALVLEHLCDPTNWNDGVAIILSAVLSNVDVAPSVGIEDNRLREVPSSCDIRMLTYVKSLSSMNTGRTSCYPGLDRQLIYKHTAFPVLKSLTGSIDEIRSEVARVPEFFFKESPYHSDTYGYIKVLNFYHLGQRYAHTFAMCPTLGRIIDGFKEVVRAGIGQVYVARLAPHTYLPPRTGASNMYVRAIVPLNTPGNLSGILLEECQAELIAGQPIVFDNAARHEEWNDSDDESLLLYMSLWHPSLTVAERDCLGALHQTIRGEAETLNRQWIRDIYGTTYAPIQEWESTAGG